MFEMKIITNNSIIKNKNFTITEAKIVISSLKDENRIYVVPKYCSCFNVSTELDTIPWNALENISPKKIKLKYSFEIIPDIK